MLKIKQKLDWRFLNDISHIFHTGIWDPGKIQSHFYYTLSMIQVTMILTSDYRVKTISKKTKSFQQDRFLSKLSS